MGDLQVPLRLDITFGTLGKHDNAVADVVFHRINVPIGRVNVNATIELHVGLRTADHALGLGPRRTGRRIVEPVEYPDAPCIAVLQEHFVEPHIDSDRRVNGIGVADIPHRRTVHRGGTAGILSSRLHGTILKCSKQIVFLRAGWRLRRTHFCQFLDGNQSSRADGGLTRNGHHAQTEDAQREYHYSS